MMSLVASTRLELCSLNLWVQHLVSSELIKELNKTEDTKWK